MTSKRLHIFSLLITIFLLVVPLVSVGSTIFSDGLAYFRPYWSDQIYRNLENLYNASQYRQKSPTSLIADETVFRYAAGAYMRGTDPILINSETMPLGKYIIGVSLVLFRTEVMAIVFFAMLSLVALWLIGRVILPYPWYLIPVALFSLEKVYLGQLRVTPLMDIIQLPFILLTIYFFHKEHAGKYFIVTPILLGVVAAIKSVIPAGLIAITFCIFLLWNGKKDRIIQFFLTVPLSGFVLLAVYARTFLNGYSFLDFLGFQKWILFYQHSKLIFPFSFWKLMYLNQWQAWWGDRGMHQAEDWQILWPVLATLPFVAVFHKRDLIKKDSMMVLLLTWVFVYEAFLSIGAVVTRFLLPLLPILYIIGMRVVFDRVKLRKP